MLLLLLLESEAPLVVDQPEDDLDNRFITEGVVPIMRQEKRRRQFVFSTHNANIPGARRCRADPGLAARGGQGRPCQDSRAYGLHRLASRCANWSKRFSKAARTPSKCGGSNTGSEQ